MTKRLFLKLLSLAGFGKLIPISPVVQAPAQGWEFETRHYLTSCRWDELIGLRFHWKGSWQPNPDAGSDWIVCGKEVSTWFNWKGTEVRNYRQNKYYARPVGKAAPLQLLSFQPVTIPPDTIDYSRVNLGKHLFYRV
jgi:hypothetical protein